MSNSELANIVLQTDRLVLRPPRLDDAPLICVYLNNLRVTENLLRPPYPYRESDARTYLLAAIEGRSSGYWFPCAIERKQDGLFIGNMGLSLTPEFNRGELGYWLGEPFWNRGYATEALAALINFGFNHFDLIRVQANHFTDNPASGRVMQKAGMTYEGTLRHYFVRFDKPKDAAFYGILREEWQRQSKR